MADPQGLIEEYLTKIFDTNQSKGKYKGAQIDCTEDSGASLLAKQLIIEEKKFRQGEPIQLPRRETLGYIGHGAFGIVFVKRVGRAGKSENLFACKIIESDDLEKELNNEVYYQKIAAQHNIAPLVYDYYLYNCEDGKTRGVIIMQFLDNYIKGYEFQSFIETTFKRQFYETSRIPWPGTSILQTAESNLNLLNEKLEQLKIFLPDFQTNFMINKFTYDVKAVDFGMARPYPVMPTVNEQLMEEGGKSRKSKKSKKSRKSRKSKKSRKSRKSKKSRKSRKSNGYYK